MEAKRIDKVRLEMPVWEAERLRTAMTNLARRHDLGQDIIPVDDLATALRLLDLG